MLVWCSQAVAGAPVQVVVSFSILEDIVRRIGGTEVAVTSLIGPDSDAHVFEPSPDQARPSMVTGPGRTTRVRDMKSGKPGGTSSARGAMRVTDWPGSSASCRYR